MTAGEAEVAEQQLRQRAKEAVRRQMRTVRDALPRAACDARSQRIAGRVLALPELAVATTVLSFATIGNEVNTRALIGTWLAAGKRVGLPRVAGDNLVLHHIESSTELLPGAFSVPEPPKEAPTLEPDEVDFALVPALAADPRGYRIGYGGGYYDKLLPRLSRAHTCAVVFDFQLIAEVPELPFDFAVDLVVTDERLIRTS